MRGRANSAWGWRAIAMRLLALGLAAIGLVGRARAQLPITLPLERTLAELASPDAGVRRGAAERLATVGDDASVRPALVAVLAGEAVPEVRFAVVRALARRAGADELAPLALAWDRVGMEERRLVLAAAEAIGGETGRGVLRAHLGPDPLGARACEGLARAEGGMAMLTDALATSEGRVAAWSCLVQAPPSEARDAALLSSDVEPVWAGPVLRALVDHDDERLRVLARAVVDREDAVAMPAALAWLARHAPGELAVERWRGWAAEADDRGASALRALLVLAPEAADAALDEARVAGGARAAQALETLRAADAAIAVPRIALFADLLTTRDAALDALASAGDIGARALAALPSAPDVELALATSRPDGAALDTLRARIDASSPARALLLSSVAGLYDASDCPLASASDMDARRRAAACIALSARGDRAAIASAALEREREPGTVAWLALAAHGGAVHADALLALLAEVDTRAAALPLIPASRDGASPDARRTLDAALSRATRSSDVRERAAALLAAGAAGDARRRGAVIGALEDDEPSVRLAAAIAARGLGLSHDPRVLGRARIETDPRVRAALDGAVPPLARRPLHVRVAGTSDGEEGDADARLRVLLADGRLLELPPIDGELVLFGVPDAPAEVHLAVERH